MWKRFLIVFTYNRSKKSVSISVYIDIKLSRLTVMEKPVKVFGNVSGAKPFSY